MQMIVICINCIGIIADLDRQQLNFASSRGCLISRKTTNIRSIYQN